MDADSDPDSDPTRPDPPLTPERIKLLMDRGQGGDAQGVGALCEAWLGRLPVEHHLERFWLRSVQFFCAQAADTGLDQEVIVEDMVEAAERSGRPTALAAALACRAILAATRGRHAQANPDLARAVVLLSGTAASTVQGLPDRHLRRVAHNTLALAFNRQGFHDDAAGWLRTLRQLIRSDGDSARFGTSIVTFNEAWIHVASAIERDLGEFRTPEQARTSYRTAARLFVQAEEEAALEPGTSPVIGPGGALAEVAALLAGNPPGADEQVATAADTLVRPDHRALQDLALAHHHAILGDTARAEELLDRAAGVLPPDHSFRSIAARIQWERIRLAALRSPDTEETAYSGMVELLLAERRSEYRTRRAAYEERLQQEQDRVVLVAERAAAELDPLTGLLSRRNLDGRLTTALSVVDESRSAVLVFIDLDEFKRVNDRRSHLVGDLTLRLLGDALRQLLHGPDFAARYGGDEFVLVLFDRSAEDIRDELTTLQRQFLHDTAAHPDIGMPVTFTAGALLFDRTATPHDLLHRADLAMIAGKRAGPGLITIVRDGARTDRR